MTTLTNTQYNGNRAKAGGICFDEHGRLRIFVGYCDNCRGKVVMPREEAETFAKKYAYLRKSFFSRLLIFEVKRRRF